MQRSSTIMWVGTVRSLPLKEQLSVAAAVGCDALSITPYNYTRWLAEGISTADMLTMAADSNVKLAHLDPYARWTTHWKPDNVDPAKSPIGFRGFAGDDFFRVAEALKVDSMSAIVCCPISQVSTNQLVDAFGETCDRAAKLGMRCDLEFIPFWGLPDLASAWKIVRTVGRPNSGIVFDFWHYLRGQTDPALLASIPGDKISTVQITDGDANLPADRSMVQDCLFHRKPPGDGGLPIVELLKQLHAIGGLNRVGPEIFSAEFDASSPQEIARRCRSSLVSAFAHAGIPHRFSYATTSD